MTVAIGAVVGLLGLGLGLLVLAVLLGIGVLPLVFPHCFCTCYYVRGAAGRERSH